MPRIEKAPGVLTRLRFASPSPSPCLEDFHSKLWLILGTKGATLMWPKSARECPQQSLWDQAAACSIGEKGSPRLSATAL